MMSAKSSPFRVGEIDCVALRDGVTVIGAAGILKRYPDATETDYRQAFADIGQSLDEAESSLNILLARVGGETLLVDAGEGGRPRGGFLLEGMALAGIAPESVTRVILTHTHGDHVQGLLTADGTPTFPNAIHVISAEELAFWRGRIAQGTADHGPILAMMEAKGLRAIGMDEAILPGVTAVPLPGHTPGQIGVLLESEGQRLIHMADALHSPMQFAHPEWSPSFDADTRFSVPTRRHALGRAADREMLAMFYHLPFPGVGRVHRADPGFLWEPLEKIEN
ncbi:MAG: MBL fold metallo-hydrolase [Chloroflexi bacterium]|nr:MBL fold metallo-hydrolase [Chloroflexota bacterium]